MTWVKIDDRANEHRKQAAAGPVACWLWTCGLMYCNRQEKRDGFIPASVVPMLFPGSSLKLAQRLVDVGLWEIVAGNGSNNGFHVHDYFQFQPTQEDIEARKAEKSEKARRAARIRWDAKRNANAYANASKTHCETDAEAMRIYAPDPDPLKRNIERKNADAFGATLTGPPDDIPITEDLIAWAFTAGIPKPTKADVEHCLADARAKGQMFANWTERFKKWLLHARSFRNSARGNVSQLKPEPKRKLNYVTAGPAPARFTPEPITDWPALEPNSETRLRATSTDCEAVDKPKTGTG